jgi:hypothetical protein
MAVDYDYLILEKSFARLAIIKDLILPFQPSLNGDFDNIAPLIRTNYHSIHARLLNIQDLPQDHYVRKRKYEELYGELVASVVDPLIHMLPMVSRHSLTAEGDHHRMFSYLKKMQTMQTMPSSPFNPLLRIEYLEQVNSKIKKLATYESDHESKIAFNVILVDTTSEALRLKGVISPDLIPKREEVDKIIKHLKDLNFDWIRTVTGRSRYYSKSAIKDRNIDLRFLMLDIASIIEALSYSFKKGSEPNVRLHKLHEWMWRMLFRETRSDDQSNFVDDYLFFRNGMRRISRVQEFYMKAARSEGILKQYLAILKEQEAIE